MKLESHELPKEAQELLKRIVRLTEASQWEEAEVELSNVLKLFPLYFSFR